VASSRGRANGSCRGRVALAALLLVPAGHIAVVQDRIVVIVFAAVVAAVGSGVLGFRVRRNPFAAVGYALATEALTIVPVAVLIALLFEINCGDGDTSGAC
jgi:hypothetical protein